MRKFGLFVVRSESLVVLNTVDLLDLENEPPFSKRHARFVHVFADLMKGSDTSSEIPSLGLLYSSTSVAPVDFPYYNFGKLPPDCVAYDVVCGLFYHA
ncbi:hypothetical protein CYMTET_47320 [Cymbomonas tetramitiformis]|nr:hypothetical protein CYMTET_47320 [Cymbomonas tetramitiformis]